MKFKNPVSVVSPVDGEHAANKDYVDNKQVTISWAEYQALSEEEKNNGTLYDIPDMPTAGQGGIITTYTALEQLGLSAGASVADIVNTMPDCSYAEIGCHREENPYRLEHITGLPSEDGNFILTVRKYNLYRVDIQAKTSASGAVMNDLHIGGMLANGTSVSWKRVCTTSVAESSTTVSDRVDSSIATNNGVYCTIKNGYCTINFNNLKPVTSGRELILMPDNSIPKPANSFSYGHLMNWTDNTAILIKPTSTGSLLLWNTNTTVQSVYYGSITYPILES